MSRQSLRTHRMDGRWCVSHRRLVEIGTRLVTVVAGVTLLAAAGCKDDVDPGSLALSGPDASQLGSVFEPEDVSEGFSGESVWWGPPVGERPRLVIAFEDGGPLTSVSFSERAGSDSLYDYQLVCAVEPEECNSVALNLAQRSVTFDSTALPPRDLDASDYDQAATAPLTLGGTLRW